MDIKEIYKEKADILDFSSSTEFMDYAYRQIMCANNTENAYEIGLEMTKILRKFCKKHKCEDNYVILNTWLTYTIVSKVLEI